MAKQDRDRTASRGRAAGGWARGAALLAAGLALLAGANVLAARRAERRHPPAGRFIEVDGVRLHYTDQGGGPGPPIVLLHGVVVSGEDFTTSGLVDALSATHRVVVFDRPGFGHSARPRRLWTAEAQAVLLAKAMARLGLRDAVVVGHSWGAIVALAIALHAPGLVGGLVLLSGYYFSTLRADLPLAAANALPGLGDLNRYTLSPLLGRLLMPLVRRAMFAPAPVTARFRRFCSDAMALRPWQIRASAEDGLLMVPAALAFRGRLGPLPMPVAIMAGAGDRVVFARMASRLHQALPGSTLAVIPGAGHMLHHTAPSGVATTIEAVAVRAAARARQSAPGEVAEPARVS